MAGADVILSRLCDLQNTNFELVDCQVKDNEVVWRIQHRAEAFYICRRFGAKNTTCHDTKWITLWGVPFGKKSCKWLVKRARILCSSSLRVSVEKIPFRSEHHFLTQRFWIRRALSSCSGGTLGRPVLE